MPQKMGSSSAKGGRVTGDIGTDVVTGDIVRGAGFGTTSLISIQSGSNDVRGTLTVTCDATAAQATATLVYTFSDGAYPVAPHCMVNVHSDSAITDSGSVRSTCTTTALTITLDVLPVDTKIYVFTYLSIA